jgi:hypothetical protein
MRHECWDLGTCVFGLQTAFLASVLITDSAGRIDITVQTMTSGTYSTLPYAPLHLSGCLIPNDQAKAEQQCYQATHTLCFSDHQLSLRNDNDHLLVGLLQAFWISLRVALLALYLQILMACCRRDSRPMHTLRTGNSVSWRTFPTTRSPRIMVSVYVSRRVYQLEPQNRSLSCT